MAVRKQESFMRGALMLSLAALVSRLLGAFYKPIIARIFAPFDGANGAAGIGLTQVPLSAYQIILSFTSVGLNVGISRLVAERMALGDARGAKRVFRLSLTLMAGLGLAASLVMWFGAPWIARAISSEAVATIPGFRATAPALFITSVMAAYRGLFQGFQQMTPNAYSQIIEQVIRVGSGMVLTFFFVQKSVAYGAAGFNFGDVIGAAAGLLYLLALASRTGEGLWHVAGDEAATLEPPSYQAPVESPWEVLKRIFAVSGPIAFSGAVVPLMMMADTFFVFRSVPNPDAQYGLLTNAFMIVYLPAVFTTAIYTSILPAITQAMTRGETDQARRKATQAYRMTMLLAIPAQTGLYVLAPAIYALLFRDTAGAVVLAAISWATVPIMLQQTTSGVLQGAGRIVLPVRNFLIGGVIKVALSAYWTPRIGISGAAYATAAGFFVAAVLNVVYVEQILGRTLKTRGMLLKPLVAALAMAGVIWLARSPLSRLGRPGVATLALIGIGGAVYGVVLLLVGGVKRQELEFIPKVGRPLAALLERTRLLR
jgi:stage V sporulation protein B